VFLAILTLMVKGKIRKEAMPEFNEDGEKIAMISDYEQESYKQFIRDVRCEGYEPTHYNGRFFFKGPCIIVENIQDGIRATNVEVQWDNMGRDYVIYPK